MGLVTVLNEPQAKVVKWNGSSRLEVVLDEDVQAFLADLKPSTAETYRPSMKHLTLFFRDLKLQLRDGRVVEVASPRNALNLIIEDRAKGLNDKNFIEREIGKAFRKYLESYGLKPKGMANKAAAWQSYAQHEGVENVSMKYTQMPDPIVQTKSYPWTNETFGKFLGLCPDTKYRAIFVGQSQSGLGIGDITAIPYKVIQKDFEAGIDPIGLDLVRHKTSVEHVTFFSTETIALLHQLFKEEGTPCPDERIFDVKERSVQDYMAVRAHKMLGDYGDRNPMNSHSIRKLFRKKVVNAGCPESYAEYWEAHNLNGDLRKTYTAMSMDEWRVEYRKYAPALKVTIIEPEAA